jgi:hypothetical protein
MVSAENVKTRFVNGFTFTLQLILSANIKKQEKLVLHCRVVNFTNEGIVLRKPCPIKKQKNTIILKKRMKTRSGL